MSTRIQGPQKLCRRDTRYKQQGLTAASEEGGPGESGFTEDNPLLLQTPLKGPSLSPPALPPPPAKPHGSTETVISKVLVWVPPEADPEQGHGYMIGRRSQGVRMGTRGLEGSGTGKEEKPNK